jgi:hypothetical protein
MSFFGLTLEREDTTRVLEIKTRESERESLECTYIPYFPFDVMMSCPSEKEKKKNFNGELGKKETLQTLSLQT